jgi:CTP synthase
MVELKNHPWFVASQFHPEYRSTVVNPHPLFVGFVKAAMNTIPFSRVQQSKSLAKKTSDKARI